MRRATEKLSGGLPVLDVSAMWPLKYSIGDAEAMKRVMKSWLEQKKK